MKKCFLLIFMALLPLLQSCDRFPEDPNHTLEKVENGTLLVGYSENPPWVVKTAGEPTGIEPAIVKAFARTVNADVEWKSDNEQALFKDLEQNKLHLVIAGITNDTPWKKKVALTRPYFKQNNNKHVLATSKGENAFVVALERYLFDHQKAIKATVKP